MFMVAHLIHASLVESHDGGMGEPVKHSAQRLLRVKLLWLEKLFQELFVEHCGDNIIHNCAEKKKEARTHYSGVNQLHHLALGLQGL